MINKMQRDSMEFNPCFTFKITNADCYYRLEKINNLKIKSEKGCGFILPPIEYSEVNTAYESVIEWIKNKSESIENKPIFSQEEVLKISELFIADQTSLEILFVLELEGKKSISRIIEKYKRTDILVKLLDYDLISISNRNVSVTSSGTIIVKRMIHKLREK